MHFRQQNSISIFKAKLSIQLAPKDMYM